MFDKKADTSAADLLFGGSASKQSGGHFDVSAFTLASIPVEKPAEIIEGRASGNEIKYLDLVPVSAPANFSIKFHDAKPTWNSTGIDMICNVVFFIERALAGTSHSQISECLRSLPIDLAPQPSNSSRPIPPGAWFPDQKVFQIDQRALGEYFQLLGVLLHEADHALNDKTPPQTVTEQLQVEIRAHTSTLERLDIVNNWMKSLSGIGDSTQKNWAAEMELVIALQRQGLAQYQIISDVILKIYQECTLACNKDPNKLGQNSVMLAVRSKSFDIVQGFISSDARYLRFATEISELIQTTKLLCSIFPEIGKQILNYEDRAKILFEANNNKEEAQKEAFALRDQLRKPH